MATPVYRSQTPFTDKGSATLVVTCGSNAFAPYVREFLERHLALPEGTYDSLAVPGGPQFLLLTEYLPKFAWAGHRWVKFLVEHHRLRRAVLVGHEDCAWHDDERMIPALLHRLAAGPAGPDSGKDRQLEGLRQMARALHELLPSLAVEAYFAGKEPDGRVGFLRVD
ncbi:MAG TPA: hypothetical protein VGW35_08675 [Methylomirabilota bacterium]|jgi:hypothetical protein|nr:hypothetical protein [Methylomirabilota bacterium]